MTEPDEDPIHEGIATMGFRDGFFDLGRRIEPLDEYGAVYTAAYDKGVAVRTEREATDG